MPLTAVRIRTLRGGDRDQLRALFARAGGGPVWSPIRWHDASEAAVRLTPYVDQEPASLFVAVVDGTLVGYVTGRVDSSTFPSGAGRMSPAIRHTG